jgi:hypothetical protein
VLARFQEGKWGRRFGNLEIELVASNNSELATKHGSYRSKRSYPQISKITQIKERKFQLSRRPSPLSLIF